MHINIHQAKTHLSRLLTRVMAGEEIIIAKAGRPVARLVPITERPAERMPGSAAGRIALAPDFDEALPNEVLDSFEQ